MPLAVTHVISSIVVVDIYRDYILKNAKRFFTLHTILIAGIAGLLPDIDVPLNWFLQLFGISSPLLQHGGITHTPFFGLIFLIPGFMLLKKNPRWATYFFVITFGVLFHISLDYLLGGGAYEGIMFFWPLSAASYKLHLLLLLPVANIPVAIDALVLLAWLWHEEAKHKIRDFI